MTPVSMFSQSAAFSCFEAASFMRFSSSSASSAASFSSLLLQRRLALRLLLRLLLAAQSLPPLFLRFLSLRKTRRGSWSTEPSSPGRARGRWCGTSHHRTRQRLHRLRRAGHHCLRTRYILPCRLPAGPVFAPAAAFTRCPTATTPWAAASFRRASQPSLSTAQASPSLWASSSASSGCPDIVYRRSRQQRRGAAKFTFTTR